ncbi:hypothetical protein [Streptomyces kurssanovii]|uniref:Uncharacterized protein n=1 Tax=Streptomyces kurssanovii TaxID=67312 RepID=A0ABV3HLR4_9ACTN
MEIFPRVGVPGARFGQTRATVRAARGAPDSAFRRAAAATLTDMYVTAAGGHGDGEERGDGFFEFLEYDDAGVLHAVEVASPAPVTLDFVEREAELFFPDAGFGVLTARDAPDLPTTAVVLSAGRRAGDPAPGEHTEGTGLLR